MESVVVPAGTNDSIDEVQCIILLYLSVYVGDQGLLDEGDTTMDDVDGDDKVSDIVSVYC